MKEKRRTEESKKGEDEKRRVKDEKKRERVVQIKKGWGGWK